MTSSSSGRLYTPRRSSCSDTVINIAIENWCVNSIDVVVVVVRHVLLYFLQTLSIWHSIGSVDPVGASAALTVLVLVSDVDKNKGSVVKRFWIDVD